MGPHGVHGLVANLHISTDQSINQSIYRRLALVSSRPGSSPVREGVLNSYHRGAYRGGVEEKGEAGGSGGGGFIERMLSLYGQEM